MPISEVSQIQCIESFLFNDEMQNIVHKILNNVEENNIFEITGMGNQEIKHSRFLAWVLSTTSHGLLDSVFNAFMKNTIENTREHVEEYEYPYTLESSQMRNLQKYLYLPKKSKTLEAVCEEDNIDIVLLDKNNKYAFIIENKIWHVESEEQLSKYRQISEEKYKNYQRYYIFLSPDDSEPSEESYLGEENRKNYMVANYENVYKAINEVNKKRLNPEVSMMLRHYNDLLIRNNIVQNEEIKNLCQEIWQDENMKKALEIIYDYKPSEIDAFRDKLENAIRTEFSNVSITEFSRSDKQLQTQNYMDCISDKKHFYFGYYAVQTYIGIWVKLFHDTPEMTAELLKKEFPSLTFRKNGTGYLYTVSRNDREKILNSDESMVNTQINMMVDVLKKLNKLFVMGPATEQDSAVN